MAGIWFNVTAITLFKKDYGDFEMRRFSWTLVHDVFSRVGIVDLERS